MTKDECIKLINTIRLRKSKYSGKDNNMTYSFCYQRNCHYRGDDGEFRIDLTYDEGQLSLADGNSSLALTFVYNHQVTARSQRHNKDYSLDQIKRYHPGEAFIPHVCPGHPTTHGGGLQGSIIWGTDLGRFAYKAGLYAAIFFLALDIKEPRLKWFNGEWLVLDSKLGHFDFVTYFSHHQIIPINLPFKEMINPTTVDLLKVAEGVEIADAGSIRSDLDDIRQEIYG